MPSFALLASSLWCFQTFAAAKPFQQAHDSSDRAEDSFEKHLLDPLNGPASDLLKAFATRSTPSEAAQTLLKRSNTKTKRQDNASSSSGSGGWRFWVPYGATRPGNYVNNAETNTPLSQLLSDFDSSFEALLNYFAEEYQASSETFGSTNIHTVHSKSQSGSSLQSQTRSPISAQSPDVVFDPFPSIHPIPPPSAQPLSQITATSAAPSSVNSNTNGSHRFDPNRPDLTAVYYAQSPATQQVPLSKICSDPSIDIIILAFVSYFFSSPYPGPAFFPTLNLASKCWGPNAAQTSAGATGLIDCVSPGFAAEVLQCQQQGKKVLLSLGGAQGNSDTAIPGEEKAVELAEVLWDLFLGGTENAATKVIRPFGDVVLDGIDIDNENPNGSEHLPILASRLRSLFASHTNKPYYLSAAPQCPRPDASIPTPLLLNNLDFIMPQFYNNPSCNLDSVGFLDSLTAWSNDISHATNFVDTGNGLTSPRLLIGAAANAAAAGAGGFVHVETYKEILGRAKGLGLGTLGGGMFWDGAWVELSKGGSGNAGEGFADAVGEVLG